MSEKGRTSRPTDIMIDAERHRPRAAAGRARMRAGSPLHVPCRGPGTPSSDSSREVLRRGSSAGPRPPGRPTEARDARDAAQIAAPRRSGPTLATRTRRTSPVQAEDVPTSGARTAARAFSAIVLEDRLEIGRRARDHPQDLAVAVCCSRLGQLVVPCFQFLNSRTFSIAITAWSAKVSSSAICSSRERPRPRARRDDDRPRSACPRAAAAPPAALRIASGLR